MALKLKSEFALLDVKQGRTKLAKVVKHDSGRRVPVTITGYITGRWGNDDGISIEFEVEVEKVVCGETEDAA